MSYHTSQQPFLFAALSSCTSTPVFHSKMHSFGSVNSCGSSIISSISSINPHHNGANSFYNLSKDSNRSNMDLTGTTQYLPHHPYPSVYNHNNYSNTSINHHTMRDHSIYSIASGASSCRSFASSQYSGDKVNHAFGSLPPSCRVPSFSASTSSLPLASFVKTPLTTSTTPKLQNLSSVSSLSGKQRLQPHSLGQYRSQQQKHKQYRTLSSASIGSEISLPRTVSSVISSSSLRSLFLPAVGQLPLRKKMSSTIPPLDTKTLPRSVHLSPYAPSKSATMSTNSPRSSAPSSIASGNISSKDSNASVSPTTPTKSRPIAAMAITDLVISEAHYLTAIKRVTNALDRFTESTLAAGRKESAVIRSLIDRWTEMMRVHARFHDDVISTNEDLREIAALISSLLVTIEPMLVDHSRELSNSLKKLTRRDQSSAHSFAEWDSFLRQPFEHLISYDEWLQRIDPQSNFCKEYRAHLNGVIYKIKMAAEANPQPRNMLSRLSTMARGVIKRRSSVQIADVDPSAPQTPATPDTPLSTHMTDSNNTLSTNVDRPNFHHFTKRHSSVLLFLPETVKNLAVTDHEKTTEVVMESMSSSNINNNDQEKEREQEKELPTIRNMDESDLKEPSTPITDTFLAPIHAVRQLQHQSSTPSELSSAGTLAIENSPSLVYSSDSSTYSESSSCAETLQGRPINSASSLARQKFLAEKENRKATLRIGTSVAIQAKTESLHSPSSATKSSIESLRKASPVTSASDKPPVKSLINFWEQVSDPLDD